MKVGELFVDLDFRAGNALNQLTNFSIKFLALKTAVEQMVGLFDKMVGGTGRYGQELHKTNQITGFSVKMMQELENKEEQLGVSAGTTLNALKNLQKANADILQGQGNIKPFQKLGVDMSRMREPVEVLDEIMAKVLKLEKPFQRTMLAEFGLSEDLLVVWQEHGHKLRDNLLLTQKETGSLNEMTKSFKYLQQAMGGIFNKTVAKYADDLANAFKKIGDWLANNQAVVETFSKVFLTFLVAATAKIIAFGIASAVALGPWLLLAGAIGLIAGGISKIKSIADKTENIKEEDLMNFDKKSPEERARILKDAGLEGLLGEQAVQMKGRNKKAEKALLNKNADWENKEALMDELLDPAGAMLGNEAMKQGLTLGHLPIERTPTVKNITYTDNSQTTINTSKPDADAVKEANNEYANFVQSFMSGIGNVEMQSQR